MPFSDDESAAVLGHLGTVTRSPRFHKAPMRSKALQVLVKAALTDSPISDGYDFADRVYGNASLKNYNNAKALLHELRDVLKIHYAESISDPSIRFLLPSEGWSIRFQFDKEGPPSKIAFLAGTWRRYAALAALLLLVIILTAAGIVLFNTRANLPADILVTDGAPSVVNSDGKVLGMWAELMRPPAGFDMNQQGHLHQNASAMISSHLQAVVLPSVPGRDYPVVVIARVDSKPPFSGNHLKFYDGRDGTLLHEISLPFDVASGSTDLTIRDNPVSPEIHPIHFHLQELRAVDLDGDGWAGELLLSLMMAIDYPMQVLAFSYVDHFELQRNHWNIGHVQEPLVLDIDSDGLPELVMAGTNNDFDRGIISFLELDGSSSRSPEGPAEKSVAEIMHLPEGGKHIMFPRSEIAKILEYRSIRGIASVDPDTFAPDEMVVKVSDVPPRNGLDDHKNITFDITPGKPRIEVELLAFDWYRTEMMAQIESGKIEDNWQIVESDNLIDYADSLAGQLLYWDETEEQPDWRPLTPEKLPELFR